MAGQVVRLNANLQPDVATALDDLAERIGGNKTTALHQAILLAALLYREADNRGTIQVKKLGSAPQTLVLPKIDPKLANLVADELQQSDPVQAEKDGPIETPPETDAGAARAVDDPAETAQADAAG